MCHVPLTPLPPQVPRKNDTCQHAGCAFVYQKGGMAEMGAHLNRTHRNATQSAPPQTKCLFGNLCHLGCGHRCPTGGGGTNHSNSMAHHLELCPGAVRTVDPIRFEDEGGEMCQLTAMEESVFRAPSDLTKHALFRAVPLERVTHWDGEIARNLPRSLVPFFHSQTEALAADYVCSPIGAIRREVSNADRMYQRLVWRNAGTGKGAINTLSRRVDDWECGRWEKLMEELDACDAVRVELVRRTTVKQNAGQVGKRVQRETEDGNFRKGLQALVNAVKFHGKWEDLTALYPNLVEILDVIMISQVLFCRR